jgi:hypothetical protein
LNFSAIKTSRFVIGFKFELNTNISEIHDASFNIVNVKPVTGFEDGVWAARQSNDSYVEFKAADSRREIATYLWRKFQECLIFL